VGWSYIGYKDFTHHPKADECSVVRHVTPAYPPSFVSAGNADPLIADSLAMAEALAANGVPVERLFYPRDHNPPLGHEYQFRLDTETA
jgi:acetyl esterase/lipase